MKASGWMVNLPYRRVEPVVLLPNRLNRGDYACYRGPKRTYMLHDCQVFDTELLAMGQLYVRMSARYDDLAYKAAKYATEFAAVIGALEDMKKRATQ